MKLCITVLALLSATTTALAQTEMLRLTDGSSVGLEFLIPSISEPSPPGYESSLSGYTAILSGNASISEMFSARVEIPFVQTKTSYSGFGFSGSASKSSLANIYLGVGIGPASGMVNGEFGVRLGTLPEENVQAIGTGILGDFPALERYMTTTTIIRGGVNFHPRVLDNIAFLATFRPSVWLPDGGENIWISYYGLGAAYETDLFKIGAGVNGLWIMKKDVGLFLSRKQALHHFQAEANMLFGIIRPGVMIRLPLDKELEMTKSTLGFSVAVLL